MISSVRGESTGQASETETVIRAVTDAMCAVGNPGRGAHAGAMDASRIVFETRCALAELFHAERPDRIAFTPNSTAALNIAIAGLFGPGDHVISTDLEHNSVLRPLYRLEEQGGRVDYVPADANGQIRYEDFAGLLRPQTRGIVCTHASNLTGDGVDIGWIGRFACAHGLTLVVDASQSAGTLPIDMQAQGIDVLCFTGHKGLLGPQGTGGLCIRPGVEIRPLLRGGTGVQSFLPTQPASYPTWLEAGTLNSHGIAGLCAALDFLKETGIEKIHAREMALLRRFHERLCTLPGIRMYGCLENDQRAHILALELEGWDASELSDALWLRYGIATRAGAHCAPRLHRALGTAERGLVRFSWSWYNTEEETDAAAQAVARLAEGE